MKLVTRRQFLHGGLLTGSLFLPGPYAWVWAQSEGAMKLLRLPKVALVFGNSKYQRVATLRNPANDASAMAQALRESGFEVTLRLDATRKEMLEAFHEHAQKLAATKCVGLVYFAGHGFQVAWRNYLVPVEAAVERVEDVAARCVDIGGLFDLITRAGNPMNVIILDACRDNPFSADFRLASAGLSQMDAPPATLLAYATAPGNTASDGEGANGLYTANLLREMKVNDAKIEDVFKRVRLGVRRASNGAQIPWESTSLEEDFYFKPPEQLRKLSQEEADREFRLEQALFEQARTATTPKLVEQYLRSYPNGRFAELAQHRLDALLAAEGEKRVEVISPKDNPSSAGFARADTRFKLGDQYAYRRVMLTPREEPRDLLQTVTAIVGDEVIFNRGLYICDLLGNTLLSGDGRRFRGRQELPFEYQVGKRWTTQFEVSGAGRGERQVSMEYRITAREKLTVPAGTFDCFRIEGRGVGRAPGTRDSDVYIQHWRAPDQVRRPIASEERVRQTVRGHVTETFRNRIELLSFRQS
jgi:hypothetical protein